MILLNPHRLERGYPDEASREIMCKTIEFFESKGKEKIKEDDRERVWYSDFLDFVKREKIFATLLTPPEYGDRDARWDTWRMCEFNEILSFYGLGYWYTWQVTILGLGPIWMSQNEELKHRAAQLLKKGAVFAFGLSEKEHGADLYSSDMTLYSHNDGTYRARGAKYYIGNGNVSQMVSTFGKIDESGEYVFFVVDSQHEKYECAKNITASQNFVAEFVLHDYPITDADILSKGRDAWDASLNTVNIGKYNLGWASIGICTHALYEAINHAANRRLYDMYVTDFPHVKRMFVDAFARLVAMKLFALRAADYMRSASSEDRRYLLYNPLVKMKVTTQGERVINLLWDIIAAKGFEKDTYFEMAARDIRALPKLEGTVHVNIALILKFVANYFFNHDTFAPVPLRDDAKHDYFLFNQGRTGGLGEIRFHDYNIAFDAHNLPNVRIFREQLEAFKELLAVAAPTQTQRRDVDFLMEIGEMFALVVYGQLILENCSLYNIPAHVVDQIFDFMVRDMTDSAVQLYCKPSSTSQQMDYCIKMIRKPSFDEEQYQSVWQEHVYALKDVYEMNA